MIEAVNLTYLSRRNVMELAPSQFSSLVAKASLGHIPLPFLISKMIKNWRKGNQPRVNRQIFLDRSWQFPVPFTGIPAVPCILLLNPEIG